MITTPRRLRAGLSPWLTRGGRFVSSRPLDDDLMADTVVVGTGISGALMALLLAKMGRSVVVVDRRIPVTGSTPASTAMVQFEIDKPLHHLERTIGVRAARAAWRRSYRAVSDLAEVVRAHRIRCGWERRSSLYVAGDLLGQRALALEVQRRAQAGVPGTLVSAPTLHTQFGIHRSAAIASDGSAAANPAQLAAGILRAAQRYGARVYRDVDVIDTDESRLGVALHTAEGQLIIANAAIFCTGYEVPRSLPKRSHDIVSTWAIAGRLRDAPPQWLRTTVVWEASDPYTYLRMNGDRRLIAGGRDEQSASRHLDPLLMRRKAALVREDAESLVPALSLRTEFAWGGAFGISPTGLPVVDRLPGHQRVWSVSGFGGNGITHSMIAAQVVSGALNGAPDVDAGLYRLRV